MTVSFTKKTSIIFNNLTKIRSLHVKPKRLTAATISLALVTQLTACGTIFFPERKGQSQGGRLDPAIVALDGIGLVLYLIPGIIAFGIDFYHGTIYLPGSKSASLTTDELKSLQKNKHVDESALKKLVNSKFDLEITDSQTLSQLSFDSVNSLAQAVQLANNEQNFARR